MVWEDTIVTVSRERANFETFGLISGKKKGNQQYYTVNSMVFPLL